MKIWVKFRLLNVSGASQCCSFSSRRLKKLETKKIIKWLQAARLTCDTTDLLFSAFHQLHLIFRRSDKKKKSLKSLVAFTVI